MFDTKAANADISESNNTLVGQVNAFSTQLASTLKIKDKAIDDELTAATSEVTGLDNEIAAIDAQVVYVRIPFLWSSNHTRTSVDRASQARKPGKHFASHRRRQGCAGAQEGH